MEDGTIYYIGFYTTLIEMAGYDPQRALLEIKLVNDGGIRKYMGVPEEIWYRLREKNNPDIYYRRYICGIFPEVKPGSSEVGV